MNTLQTNDWLILNSIIYEIYTTADFDQMRRKFLEQMKMLVDFDSAEDVYKRQVLGTPRACTF